MQTYINTQYCNSGSKQKRYGVRLTVTQNSQNIANNTTNMTIKFELGGAGALGLSTDYTGSSMAGFTYTGRVFINDVEKSSGSWSGTIGNSSVVTLTTWTGDIPNAPDGTLGLIIRGNYTGGSSSQADAGEAAGWVVFDTIPRASTLTVSTADIGTKPTFTITRASDTFTHNLTYVFGSIQGGIANGVGTSYNNWTIPTTLYSQIPNSLSGVGTVTCDTYNGDTYIGSSTASFEITVPSTAKPNISNPTLYDTDTVSRTTISPDASHPVYVLGKSKLKFTFPAFSSNYNATLGSYTLYINDNMVYSGTATEYTMTTPFTSTTGNKYKLDITDSRGISNSTGDKSITVYNYNSPACSFKVERKDNDESTVVLTYSGAITNINSNNRNTKSFTVKYRKSGSTGNWTTVSGFPKTANYTYTNVTQEISNIDEDSSFDFTMTAVDSYNASTTATAQLGTSSTLLNFNKNGKTMAFGKASEVADTIEFGIKTDFQKPIMLSDTIQGKQLAGGGGTSGYMNCFSLKTTGTYQNQALTFDVIQRSRSGRVRLILNSSATTGTATVNQCYFEGNISVHYLASNNIVTVYIQKSEAYDNIEIVNFKKGEYMKNTSITWNNTTVTALPSGYKSGSRRVGEFYYGITSTVGNNSSSNLMTSQGVYNSVLHITPVILYDDALGSNDTITLSDSAANYSYLEIYYASTQNNILRWDYTKLFSPNGKSFMCKVHWIYDTYGSTQTVTEVNTISGNQITRGECSSWNVDHNGSTWAGSYGVRAFYIYRVVGYK